MIIDSHQHLWRFHPVKYGWLKKTFNDTDRQLEKIKRRIPPHNRLTTSEETADMAVFLISDRATHITGQHSSRLRFYSL